MSDRICIHSGGRHVVRLSAGNLLACCRLCGKGCKGGFPGGAWMYWSVQCVNIVLKKKNFSKSIRQEEAGHRYRGILLLRLRKSY